MLLGILGIMAVAFVTFFETRKYAQDVHLELTLIWLLITIITIICW